MDPNRSNGYGSSTMRGDYPSTNPSVRDHALPPQRQHRGPTGYQQIHEVVTGRFGPTGHTGTYPGPSSSHHVRQGPAPFASIEDITSVTSVETVSPPPPQQSDHVRREGKILRYEKMLIFDMVMRGIS